MLSQWRVATDPVADGVDTCCVLAEASFFVVLWFFAFFCLSLSLSLSLSVSSSLVGAEAAGEAARRLAFAPRSSSRFGCWFRLPVPLLAMALAGRCGTWGSSEGGGGFQRCCKKAMSCCSWCLLGVAKAVDEDEEEGDGPKEEEGWEEAEWAAEWAAEAG